MEGDAADPLSGWCESGQFGATARVKAGSGRFAAVVEASIGTVTTLQDGRGIFTTDTNKLYHAKGAGAVQIEYINRDGSRAPTADLPMGGFKHTGLAAGSANGHSVRFEEAVLINQPRTVTGLITFNRGAAAPFAVDAASLKVTNLDADKLDGNDAAAFAVAGHNHDIDTLTGVASKARGGTGFSFATTGDIIYDGGVGASLSKLPIGTNGQWLRVAGGLPSWASASAPEVDYLSANTTGIGSSMTTTGLSKAIGANEKWLVEVVLYIQHETTSSTADVQIIGPTGASGLWDALGSDADSAVPSVFLAGVRTISSDFVPGFNIGTTNVGVVLLRAYVSNGVNAGNIDIRVSTPSGTMRVLAGSHAFFFLLS
jgi:hypothetical protein